MIKSLYATLYLPPWLRLTGAKIGKRAEISTVNYISTDLLKIGHESFLADSVNVGPPVVINGWLFKTILIGRYKPDSKPLWSTFVWRNEFINSISENLVYPFFESMFLGTPFAPIYFRIMGCKIGKKVFMETTEITEFDLVTIGDDSALNFGCTIQTHLFEDRVMKMSDVNIGKACTIGSLSVILYDTKMNDHSLLQGLSLIMKGETLPKNTHWQGSPCQLQN